MIVYLVMFAMPLLGMALSTAGLHPMSRAAWIGAGLALILIIGTRQYVGADWDNYELQFYANATQSLFETWQITDPAYATVSWLVYKSSLDIFGLNTVCAAILVVGVMKFASRQQDPWLALIVSTAYTLLVVGMGYSRQSAALGLEFFAIMALSDRKLSRFYVLGIAAVLFHKSAIVLLPLGILANTGRPVVTTMMLVATVAVALWLAAYSVNFDTLRSTYVDQRLSSDGTLVRLLVASVSAVGFIIIAGKVPMSPLDRRIMLVLSMATLASLALLSVSWTSSTAIDRIALYLFPVQMAFWGNVSRPLGLPQLAIMPRIACIGVYGLLMLIWLTNSNHAVLWLPYRSFLFQ